MNNAFGVVFVCADQIAEAERQKTAQQQENRAALERLAAANRVEWLRDILNWLDIPAEVKEAEVYVEGFVFRLGWTGGDYFGLQRIAPGRVHDPANYKPYDRYRCTLEIVNLCLDEACRQSDPRPHVAAGPIAAWRKSVHIDLPKDARGIQWHPVCAQVGQAIRTLQREQAEAPARLKEVEAWRDEQAEVERQRLAEQEAADRAWREDQERDRQTRQARQAQAQRLRAEVAARFGISTEAFDYLIEALADELHRREIDLQPTQDW